MMVGLAMVSAKKHCNLVPYMFLSTHEVLVLSLGIRWMMAGLAMVRAKKHCNLVPYVVGPVMKY